MCVVLLIGQLGLNEKQWLCVVSVCVCVCVCTCVWTGTLCIPLSTCMRLHVHTQACIYVGAHVLQLCLEWYASTIVSCYFALIISASSFVHAAASFVQNEDNTPQIPGYPHMAVKGKKERAWHIKKASTCNSLSMSIILSLLLIFSGKWALKAFSKWVHYLGLLTTILAFEHILVAPQGVHVIHIVRWMTLIDDVMTSVRIYIKPGR